MTKWHVHSQKLSVNHLLGKDARFSLSPTSDKPKDRWVNCKASAREPKIESDHWALLSFQKDYGCHNRHVVLKTRRRCSEWWQMPSIALPGCDHCECTIFCLADMQEAKRQASSQVGQSLDGTMGTCIQDFHHLSIAKDLSLTWTTPEHGVGTIAELNLLQHWKSKTAAVWLAMHMAQ